MKKTSAIIVFLSFIYSSHGQWNTNGTNIYNSNNGSVGIGTSWPERQLHILNTGTTEVMIDVSNDGYANLNLRGNSKTWTWSKRPSYENDAMQLFYHNGTNWSLPIISFNPSGNIGIGTTNPGTFKLAVEGKIGAREVKVTATNPWPDYVFNEKYKLLPLKELEKFVLQYKHLPKMPTANQVKENGIELGDMSSKLLEKIEELTLYTIELNKEIEKMKEEIKNLKKEK